MKTYIHQTKNRTSLLLGLSLLCLGGLISSNSNATLITKTKICDAATEDCEGNPETDIYKVTLDRSSGTDTSFDVDWLVPAGTAGTGGPLPVDLAGSSTWTINSFTDTDIQLSISISNDTVLASPDTTNAAILSFGFGVDPDSIVALTNPGNVFDLVGPTNSQNFPGGFKNIDICIFADGCTGGAINEGLQASNDPDVPATQNSQDSLVITISPSSGTYGDIVELLFFPAKFQGTWGSFEPGGVPNGDGQDPPDIIPEPATVLLTSLGLLGIGLSRRRKTYPVTK